MFFPASTSSLASTTYPPIISMDERDSRPDLIKRHSSSAYWEYQSLKIFSTTLLKMRGLIEDNGRLFYIVKMSQSDGLIIDFPFRSYRISKQFELGFPKIARLTPIRKHVVCSKNHHWR